MKPQKIIRADREQIEAWEKAAGTATFNSWAVRALNRASAERHETVIADLDVAEVAASVAPVERRDFKIDFKTDFKPNSQ